MDESGWEQLRPWLIARTELPVGPLSCIIDGPTRGRPWSGAAVRTAVRTRRAPTISPSAGLQLSTNQGERERHPGASAPPWRGERRSGASPDDCGSSLASA